MGEEMRKFTIISEIQLTQLNADDLNFLICAWELMIDSLCKKCTDDYFLQSFFLITRI